MKEKFLEGLVLGSPGILLAFAWWRWVVADALGRQPVWRRVGMLLALSVGSASALLFYSTLAMADNLRKNNHYDYVGRMYGGGVFLCLTGVLIAPFGKREPRLLTLLAMFILLFFLALLLGPLLTPP